MRCYYKVIYIGIELEKLEMFEISDRELTLLIICKNLGRA